MTDEGGARRERGWRPTGAAPTKGRGPAAGLAVRPARPDDLGFLRSMVYEAGYPAGAERPPLDEALAEPHNARYLDGWRRPGDAGVVALAGDRPVGAAWYRRFAPEELAVGFADPSVPELAIAVAEGHRGRGLGRVLLAALCDRARRAGFAALDLNVSPENRPALALYRRVGFAEVGAHRWGLWMRRRLADGGAGVGGG